MSFDAAALNLMLNAQGSVTLKMALHTGDPGAGGANEVSGSGYARQSCTWDAASGGIIALSGAVVFNVPAVTVTYVTLWSNDNLTRYAKILLASPPTFGAAGLLTVDSGQFQLT